MSRRTIEPQILPTGLFGPGVPPSQIPKRLFGDGNGDIDWEAPRVAIVGTRGCSPLGVADAQRIAYVAATHGAVVISGMARGIDAAAHRGALQAGGMTVGVLATGLDVEYPATNRALYREMRKHGLLITEHPLGVAPTPWRFPERNRIIAGLADVVVVVEAKLNGGAMITANLAFEFDRQVMAVPGRPRDVLAQGPNALIGDNAWPVQDPADVAYLLGCGDVAPCGWAVPGTVIAPEIRVVIDACNGQPATVDRIADRLDLPLLDVVKLINTGVRVGALRRARGLIWPIAG